MILSAAQILDDEELSCAVTERDLDVSDMETLREPPPHPHVDNAEEERPRAGSGGRPDAKDRKHDQW